MATTRHARVVLENHTESYFKFQVLHQYTGEDTDDSGWFLFAPGDSKEMFANVRYYTGFFTTGRDNWIVHGKKLEEIEGEIKTSAITINGKGFVEGFPYRSYHGFAAEWKSHTLRAEDEGQTTVIKVYKKTIDFISPSGTSSTRFDTLGDSTGRLMSEAPENADHEKEAA